MLDLIGTIATVICAIISLVDFIRNLISDKKQKSSRQAEG